MIMNSNGGLLDLLIRKKEKKKMCPSKHPYHTLQLKFQCAVAQQ